MFLIFGCLNRLLSIVGLNRFSHRGYLKKFLCGMLPKLHCTEIKNAAARVTGSNTSSYTHDFISVIPLLKSSIGLSSRILYLTCCGSSIITCQKLTNGSSISYPWTSIPIQAQLSSIIPPPRNGEQILSTAVGINGNIYLAPCCLPPGHPKNGFIMTSFPIFRELAKIGFFILIREA